MEQVKVFWVVTPCSVVAGYQRIGGPSGLLKMDPTTTLHSLRSQKTSTWNITAVKSSKLAYVH
jgi:hypothetical protein